MRLTKLLVAASAVLILLTNACGQQQQLAAGQAAKGRKQGAKQRLTGEQTPPSKDPGQPGSEEKNPVGGVLQPTPAPVVPPEWGQYDGAQSGSLCRLPGPGLHLIGWGDGGAQALDFPAVFKECGFQSKYVMCAIGPDITTGAGGILGCSPYAGTSPEDHARCRADAARMSQGLNKNSNPQSNDVGSQPTQYVCVQTAMVTTAPEPVDSRLLSNTAAD